MFYKTEGENIPRIAATQFDTKCAL